MTRSLPMSETNPASPTDEQPEVSQSERRRYFSRFVLLLALVAVVWFCPTVYRSWRQRRAVAAIIARNGDVVYDYQISADGTKIPDAPEPGPTSARALLGKDFLADVALVKFSADDENPPVLHWFDAMRRVRAVDLTGAKIGDDDLEVFQRLLTLEELHLSETQVTDKGMAELALAASLEKINLNRTAVTDSGLMALRELPNLRIVWVHGSRVTPEGKQRFCAECPNVAVMGP